jgi:carbonic anhydrase
MVKNAAIRACPLQPTPADGNLLSAMDAIDRVLMNSRLHYLGAAARLSEPQMKLAVVTCMDARVDISAVLGLRPGDAHVIRNAGGRATPDARNALVVSQAVLGTREIMVIHHTECAMGRLSQNELKTRIESASGHPFHADLGTFTDPIEAVREDLERLRGDQNLVHRDKIRGFIYDLNANAFSEVKAG